MESQKLSPLLKNAEICQVQPVSLRAIMNVSNIFTTYMAPNNDFSNKKNPLLLQEKGEFGVE